MTVDASTNPAASTPVALVDLLDRVLSAGVVISGELTLAIADVDLVHISLRALVSSVRSGPPSPAQDPPSSAHDSPSPRPGGRGFP